MTQQLTGRVRPSSRQPFSPAVMAEIKVAHGRAGGATTKVCGGAEWGRYADGRLGHFRDGHGR